jgi:prepilin-type N-terminal cleavage/methylation domain-containing protein
MSKSLTKFVYMSNLKDEAREYRQLQEFRFGGCYMEIYRTNKEGGFTLIEIVITVAIIGVLAAIGVNQFRVAQSQRELNRAAWELVADIRWMQQLSANDMTPRLSTTIPPTYRYELKLWNATLLGTNDVHPNHYQVLNNGTVLKQINFNDDKVSAQIMKPSGSNIVDITYYAYDLDRVRSGTTLENNSYQVMLTHDVTKAVMYVNVDSRVGRVWINTDGSNPL